MWIGVVTIFPEMFIVMSNYGILSKALKNGDINLSLYNPKYFVKDIFVDCRPYSYVPGVLLNIEILKNVINYAKLESSSVDTKIVYLSPKGGIVNQNVIIDFLSYHSVIFLSGRYEGIDERLFNFFIDEELSIGDLLLTGGEYVIMLLIDSIVRLLPNILGNVKSILTDSFIDCVLDSPHYTKPKLIYNVKIPQCLVSGNYFFSVNFDIKYKLGCTFFLRRDLFNKFKMAKFQYILLRVFILENREMI